jgi:radical SAM superfamily enzyme YgiQ (UPF0313 family)
MNILLFSMPDSFEHMPAVAIRMPNGALASLAGNVDSHHRVAVADLVLADKQVRQTVERLVHDRQPDLIGLSIMTFQRRTAKKLVALLRSLRPKAAIVVGGYDPSLAPTAYQEPSFDVDFIVRGEGELTFRELVRAIENKTDYAGICGLTYRTDEGWRTNPERPVAGLDTGDIHPPKREARVLSGYTFLGSPVDVVETSRGCTFDCSFCSIIEMRGRNFHTFSFDRVVRDLQDARSHGARTIFIVDDNITLNVKRFAALCRTIIDAGLNDLKYIVQAMTSSIANEGERLAPLMQRAGFRYVFLGIENVLEEDLQFLKASSKNKRRLRGAPTGNAALRAIELLHAHEMYVVGGLIVGNPSDTAESVEANLEFARRHVDWPYIQHPTPYPKTPMTSDLVQAGLVLHDRFEEYDGTTAVVRTHYVQPEAIEFQRWRAERWMKVRHLPAAFRHHPWFVVTHARKMLAHTFRGNTWKTWLRLEDEAKAFARYRAIRRAEREYL